MAYTHTWRKKRKKVMKRFGKRRQRERGDKNHTFFKDRFLAPIFFFNFLTFCSLCPRYIEIPTSSERCLELDSSHRLLTESGILRVGPLSLSILSLSSWDYSPQYSVGGAASLNTSSRWSLLLSSTPLSLIKPLSFPYIMIFARLRSSLDMR